ncbi:hypothetical protein HDU93_001265, partial [Gonapodya sp. JEL0774]
MLPFENGFVAVAIVLSLVQALALLGARDWYGKKVYGSSGTWCWIADDHFRILIYYVPAWIILLFDIIMVVYARFTLRKKASNIADATERGVSPAIFRTIAQLQVHTNGAMIRYVGRISSYLVAYCVPVVFMSINRIQNIVQPNQDSYALYVLTAFFGQLHGAAISSVFFYTEYERRKSNSVAMTGSGTGSQTSRGSRAPSTAPTPSVSRSASVQAGTGGQRKGKDLKKPQKVEKSAE